MYLTMDQQVKMGYVTVLIQRHFVLSPLMRWTITVMASI
jgi:hypothetical protein